MLPPASIKPPSNKPSPLIWYLKLISASHGHGGLNRGNVVSAYQSEQDLFFLSNCTVLTCFLLFQLLKKFSEFQNHLFWQLILTTFDVLWTYKGSRLVFLLRSFNISCINNIRQNSLPMSTRSGSHIPYVRITGLNIKTNRVVVNKGFEKNIYFMYIIKCDVDTIHRQYCPYITPLFCYIQRIDSIWTFSYPQSSAVITNGFFLTNKVCVVQALKASLFRFILILHYASRICNR